MDQIQINKVSNPNTSDIELTPTHLAVWIAVNNNNRTVNQIKSYFSNHYVTMSKSRIRHILKDLDQIGELRIRISPLDSRRRFYETKEPYFINTVK